MEAKKVWAVIIIVIGVMYVLGGIHGFFFATFAEKEISYMDESMNKAFKKIIGPSYTSYQATDGRYKKIMFNVKIWCFFSVLLGIVFSVSGTVLLNKTNSMPIDSKEKCINEPIMNLNVTEKDKDDERKWMPPELRG